MTATTAAVTTASDWITAGVAVLAFLLSVAAFVYSRRATRAAEASAKAADRSAAVAEREEKRQAQEAEERAVRWQLTSTGRYRPNRLTNVGDGTAYDVQVQVADDIKVQDHPYEKEVIGPNSSMLVGIAVTMDSADDTVTVRWRNSPDGPVRDWSHPAVEV
ncbi:hypothetical protein E4P40_13200 [Blastococcus sp. CT_GayMR20]|uniref:hypothetical protein n=1 Tax=Blastococcus sp. CT_GayMR20 TaxID=2559609 RepID=UPI00107476BE|nr:hypothetical protein [Blastococcus sp. CT_GayMR20]TFV86203.1 hypothetical protein E4P40_13075 [Blastococcus sp. CT_GayMR20]TFV86224.1 hypothetical protein E4P40_13200 [Blastococcus sp. CT_GayMR20]